MSAVLETLAGVDWAAHWRNLVQGREDQAEQLLARDQASRATWWDRRAARFHESVKRRAGEGDPLTARVAAVLPADGVLIDVGAGTGRFAIPFARRCREVIAVDPSSGMLEILRREAAAAGVDNVRCIHARWEDVDPRPRGDVAIASHSFYGVLDIMGFLRAMNDCAEHCFLFMRTEPIETGFQGLWEAFHGAPRVPEPTFVVAYNVLWQMGIRPDAQIVEWQQMMTWDDLDDALADCQERFSIPASRAGELRAWLQQRLRETDGRVALSDRPRRAGIASWRHVGLP